MIRSELMDRSQIRNFCIIAHIDHGKSTLSDRLLEITGTVDARKMSDQLLDSMELEQEKGITIKARAVRIEHKTVDATTYELNLIDTPGHVDFAYEVSRSLAAAEGALLVADAAAGIQAQTLANVYMAIEQNLTIIPVVNKIDLPVAEPELVAQELSDLGDSMLNLRFQKSLQQLEDPLQLKSNKKNIARVKTFKRQYELGLKK